MQDSSPVCFAGWRSVARLFRGLATRAMRIHAWIQDSGWKSAPSDRRSPLSAGMEPGVATPKKSAWVFAVRRWKTATGWLALATLPRPLSAPTPLPAPAARAVSPSGLRPPGLSERPRPQNKIKPKPCARPEPEEIVESDISSLRKSGHFYFALTAPVVFKPGWPLVIFIYQLDDKP